METSTTPTVTAASAEARQRPAGASSTALDRVLGLSSWLFWVALAAGAVFRLVRYADNRSLWLDESFLAINLIDRSARDLLDALEFAQSAPPAFLLAEKGALELLGDSERALRLLPLLASLASLGVFAWLVRRLLSPWGATLALALFAANDFLVYQGSELKPYSSDVLATVVLLALLVHFARGPATLLRVVPLLVVGTIAPLASFPSVLVLAGVGLAALYLLYELGSRRDLVVTAVLMAAWVAAFAVVLALSSTAVQRVSSEIFAGQPSAGEGLSQSVERSWSLFVNPGNFTDGTNALAALLAAFGLIELLWRRRRPWLAIALVVPAVLAFGAAVLERYPLGNRYSLFLLPIMLLLVVRGVEALVRDSRRGLLLAALLATFLVVPQAATALRNTASPPRDEDVRPLLVTAAEEWRDGDVLYVYRNAQYAVRYYGTCADCRPDGIEWPWPIERAPSAGTGEQFAPALESIPPEILVGTQESLPDRIAADVARLPRSGRLWVLLSHVSGHDLNEGALLRRELDARGRVAGEWASGTAELLLYDMTG